MPYKLVRYALVFDAQIFQSHQSLKLYLSMAIHIGKKIKEELYRQSISVSGFARKINRSRNVVYDIFERESIDTALLNRIGKILNCDFFSLYSSQKEYNTDSIKTFFANENSLSYGKQSEEVKSLQKQVEILQNEVNYLKKIISLMESKKKPKNS